MLASSWYFFVLLNAFYGGAMTMFFTTEAELPFTTEREVIRAHPDWNLLACNSIRILGTYPNLSLIK